MGFWEMVLIVIVAILVINPKDVPMVVFRIGQGVKRSREAWQSLMTSVNQTFDMTPPPAASDEVDSNQSAKD